MNDRFRNERSRGGQSGGGWQGSEQGRASNREGGERGWQARSDEPLYSSDEDETLGSEWDRGRDRDRDWDRDRDAGARFEPRGDRYDRSGGGGARYGQGGGGGRYDQSSGQGPDQRGVPRFGQGSSSGGGSGFYSRGNAGMYGSGGDGGYSGGRGGSGYGGSTGTEYGGGGSYGGYAGNQGRFGGEQGGYSGTSGGNYGSTSSGGYSGTSGGGYSGGYGGTSGGNSGGGYRKYGSSQGSNFGAGSTRGDGQVAWGGNQGSQSNPYRAPGGFAGRGPKGYNRTDDRIREDVCDRLSADDDVDASEIEVQVQNGEVTLTGTVPTRSMKHQAENIADDIPGVRDVNNNLRVLKGMLNEIKDKLTGEDKDQHYANGGTKTKAASA